MFGGKVHLLGRSIQFNRSVFFQRKRRAMAFIIFNHLVREALPAARHPHSNLFCSHFDECMMPTVQSVGGGIGAKQRRP